MSEGNDVIRGQYTAQPLAHLRHMYDITVLSGLAKDMIWLEKYRQHVQRVEFVIEEGKLFYLSSRQAQLSPVASVNVCVDMVRHHMISRQEAILRLDPTVMDYFLQPVLEPTTDTSSLELGKGLKTSQGFSRYNCNCLFHLKTLCYISYPRTYIYIYLLICCG